ncbi:PadR family transcriptional regulator [Acetobacterium paludosum]|uniref:PadR family transcriptional regulator n=1 Tax=Acetobacterium paludosum TaxID=52693 RepID=A0A923HYB9_9FIRM|nr:PadR family transcriptional regulator [Acetobacterium paludosum]MBC3888864.1 PadR family transcriptional regulator [Acetobacterium paludosum]
MVQLFILYYLSIKQTHGYEIQKFIQMNQMNEWNNIKSGSIYYAINKLERSGFISIVDKSNAGEKAKCIYGITEKGQLELHKIALQEMKKPLGSITAEKFLIYPIVANLNKSEIIESVTAHLHQLENEKAKIIKWEQEKQDTSKSVEKATLSMMKETINLQIKWHMALLDNIDETISVVDKIHQMIKTTDYSQN